MSDWKPLTCNACNRQISSPVPASTQIRGWLECYSCHNKNLQAAALKQLVGAICFAASQANWLDESLIDALDHAKSLYKT